MSESSTLRKERVRCYECGRRRLAAVWIEFGDRTCAALCSECAKRGSK